MFIDNPKDNSAAWFLNHSGAKRYDEIKKVNRVVNDGKKAVIEKVKQKTAALSIAKVPVEIVISGKEGTPLSMAVRGPDVNVEVRSDAVLFHSTGTAASNGTTSDNSPLSKKMFLRKLRPLNATAVTISDVNMNDLAPGLCIAFEEITHMKNKLLAKLTGSYSPTVSDKMMEALPRAKKETTPRLSVLISQAEDVHLCEETDATVYFELPDNLSRSWESLARLFEGHRELVPWFPSVLIGEDYQAAVKLLKELPKKHIVTNNTGVAQIAFEENISWTAGPYLNISNSLALHALKNEFDCQGAFISNELSFSQLRHIRPVAHMALHYSIFHPIMLMTSRQCLFHQVTGCEKEQMDSACLAKCEKSAPIVDLKATTSFIEKRAGHYHCIYHDRNYLNTAVVSELPNVFSSFLIDLRNVATKTNITLDKRATIDLFGRHIDGCADATTELHRHIHPTTANQYHTGV